MQTILHFPMSPDRWQVSLLYRYRANFFIVGAFETVRSPTNDNGFRMFVQLFGNVGETADSEFYRLQKYEKLGLDPHVPPTLTLPPEPYEILKGTSINVILQFSLRRVKHFFFFCRIFLKSSLSSTFLPSNVPFLPPNTPSAHLRRLRTL